MSEDRLLAELSADRAWKNIETMVNEFPSRLAGSDTCWQAAGFVDEQLRAGAGSELMEYQGLVSFPERATLEVISPEYRVIPANVLGHSVSTGAKPVEAELVDAGRGTWENCEAGRYRRQDRHDGPILLPAAPREAADLRDPGSPGRSAAQLGLRRQQHPPVRVRQAVLGQSHPDLHADGDGGHTVSRGFPSRRAGPARDVRAGPREDQADAVLLQRVAPSPSGDRQGPGRRRFA